MRDWTTVASLLMDFLLHFVFLGLALSSGTLHLENDFKVFNHYIKDTVMCCELPKWPTDRRFCDASYL